MNSVEECLMAFRNTCRDYNGTGGEVPEVWKPPSPLEFLRDYVNPNKPVIFKNAIKQWPAVRNWDESYLRNKIGHRNATIAVTPNGYADAVINNRFIFPEERIMTINQFLDALEDRNSKAVYYVQKQDCNMFKEFSDLLDDVEKDVPWATTAFNRTPDCVNFWMGGKRSVTSMHKDFYENLYCVVKGYKEFILHPPTDSVWIPYETYDTGIYSEYEGDFKILPKETKVPWISVDPLKPDLMKYPQYKNVTKYHCIVEAGDVFYLPSLWYHHVQQSHGCIAVNYWYDMDFDIKYCYYNFLNNVTKLSRT